MNKIIRFTIRGYRYMEKITGSDLIKKYKRKELEDLLKRKFYIIPSFQIYDGVAGLYDFGPLGCALKNNVEEFWRQHFILEDDLLEFSGTAITPERVLEVSVIDSMDS